MAFETFLRIAGVAAACAAMLGTGCASAAAAETPSDNVLIIHVDDLGWRDLGCMGSPVYETPHIDALAESGTRYTNAYAASSLCTPSRACMLTGSQPSRHGVYTVVKNRGEKEQWKVIAELEERRHSRHGNDCRGLKAAVWSATSLAWPVGHGTRRLTRSRLP